MPLEISIVTDENDFEQIAPMDYEAWKFPHNPQLRHFRPQFETREESIEYIKNRAITSLRKNDPKNFQLKVVDTDTGEVVGFAVWYVNDKPDPYGEKTIATWHPEGSEEKEFAERFINGLWGFIGKRVTRPHMDLHSLIVAQEHRHRGAGRMLIRWGINKADELGIETVVSSLKSARGAYERCGLGCIENIPPDESLNVPYPSKKWRELFDEDLSGWLMWRPVGRDFVEGLDKTPWLP